MSKNRSLSAHTALHGEFHFGDTPMVPPGTKTMVHNRSQARKSWDFHAFNAWYVGSAMKHYRCYKVVSEKTGAEGKPNTVQFNHHIVQTPTITQTDSIHKATMELTKAIKKTVQKHPRTRRRNHQTAHDPTRKKTNSTKRTHRT